MNKDSISRYENSEIEKREKAEMDRILERNSSVAIALRGVQTKTVLYVVFALIAFCELGAALGLYLMGAYGLEPITAIGFGMVASGIVHYYLHHLLDDTCASMVFKRDSDSRAMRSETRTNIVLCAILLVLVALVVNKLGAKGLEIYRLRNQPVTQTDSIKPSPIVSIEALSKNGQVITERVAAVTDMVKAQNGQKQLQNGQKQSETDRYNGETAQIVSIVGVTAFAVEVLLGLLAYAVQTAKRAASIEVESRTVTDNRNGEANATVTDNRNGEANATVTDNRNGTNNTVPNPYAEIFRQILNERPIAPTAQTNPIGFHQEPEAKPSERTCAQCSAPLGNNPRQIYCGNTCRIEAWKVRTGQEVIKHG
ncbi:MAG: hypothetical protein RIS64_3676 [Bacteroidota bacterium]|jgi:hypothetical protein